MKIAMAQINSWLGDFAGNRKKILDFAERAALQSCDIALFPEASIFGYHPCDLLERPSIVEAQLQELKILHKSLPKGIAIVVGAIVKNEGRVGKPYFNAAVWLEKKKPMRVFAKELLPTYDVFDESRHIEPGKIKNNHFKFKGQGVLVTVCEDIWAWPAKHMPRFSSYHNNPLLDVQKKKIDIVLNLSASPFTNTKLKNRTRVVQSTAKLFNAPMVYVNMVGAQDELIYDGGSFAVDKNGKTIAQCARFIEDLGIVNLKNAKENTRRTIPTDPLETRRQAIVLGLRDFIRKNKFEHVHLGLSGGIDSAVVACLAVEALGQDNVSLFAMPGPYSELESLTLATGLARNLKCEFNSVAIVDIYKQMVSFLDKGLGESEFGVMHENLQARLRAMVLMAVSNREHSLLLSTSNKSELATGFSTLYGDMSGGLVPIGDLLKHQVYEMAELYNKNGEVIPQGIIDRPPSAELRPNQRDSDSLPPYDVLDSVVENLVGGYRVPKTDADRLVLKLLMRSEFKRWQSPPVLKVSDHAFGRGRRLPLAHIALF